MKYKKGTREEWKEEEERTQIMNLRQLQSNMISAEAIHPATQYIILLVYGFSSPFFSLGRSLIMMELV